MTRRSSLVHGARFITGLFVLATVSCGAPSAPANCTDELRIQLIPSEIILLAGQAVTPTLQLSTCGGSIRLSDQFTWSSDDSDIIELSASTGRIRAIAPGVAAVTVRGQKYGPVLQFEVTVH
jgi:Big-like domain-containing protein